MVETPRQIWTVRFKEATCHEISHFGKSGIVNSGVLVMRDRDFPWWKPRDRSGPSDLRRLRVERLTASGNRGSRIRESQEVVESSRRTLMMINPDERTRFFRRISGSIMTVRCGEETSTLSRGASAP
jgi:hypothetical protein